MEQRREVGTRKDLVNYRLEIARNDLNSAKILLEAEDYRGANNRAYYAIYHAISAIYALDGVAYKRHKDALSNFNKNYIHTEIFSRKFGRKIAEAEEIRHASDYDDFYIATKSESIEMIDTAANLIKEIDEYVKKEDE